MKWTGADGTVKEWRANGLDAKVKVVCDSCNNGWMSNPENAAKRFVQDMILDPKEVTLGPNELTLIAALAFKSAVIADHIRLNKVTTQSNADALLNHSLYPQECRCR